MSLRECFIKNEYRSLDDNVVKDFYIPLLHEAKLYRRAVGFFSSSSLVEISKGICYMAEHGGKIQIVASPYLSDDDVEAIRVGYANRKSIIEQALLRQINSVEDNIFFKQERLNLLANLIADDILNIRIAITENKHGIGMYHEKMGLIEDCDGNVVAFSGSMNESATAMAINYETIDVFCNWKSDEEAARVEGKERAFCSIWGNTEKNVEVMEFPKVTEAIINKYKKSIPNFNLDNLSMESDFNSVSHGAKAKSLGARVPDNIKLYSYQKESIDNWEKNNFCGVYDMATGTGKTYTGLASIARLSEYLDDKLAVIIVCPYQHLVEQWVDDITKFGIKPIIGYSNSFQKDWKKRLEKAIHDQRIRSDKTFFCFVCTNATFASNYVQTKIDKIKNPICLVVDEAHNFGARSYVKYLDNRFRYRLALSATMERHRDEDGTAMLYDFFGKKCIEYTLEKAIEENKLTRYKYYPILVYLNEDELAEYEKLSCEMSGCLKKDTSGRMRLTKYGEILALKRSRIVAGATEKLDALRRVMESYKHDDNILVYCGATTVYDENNDDNSQIYYGDIRQIEAVIKILGKEMQMKVAPFTSNETIEERENIKFHFQNNGDLQAIVAIKCLDEGVNIPAIRTAFILASTTNPKEYIQRRGRVLRKAPNKLYAEIYDFVTLPRNLEDVSSLTHEKVKGDITLVRNELERVKEFGRLSMNSMQANSLIWEIEEVYHLNDKKDGMGEY